MLTRIRLIAVIVLCLVSFGCASSAATANTDAPAQPSFDTAALDSFITQMMEDYNVPGVGLAIVEDGKVSYTKGYGVRDVETGETVTSDTEFPIGSTTKSFTALDMMILVDEGSVDLDAPVTTYIPEFELSNPDDTDLVTVRHLLSHTTGLVRTDASTFDLNVTAEDVIEAVATTELAGKPGEVFIYSNVNTIVAGEIIERVSGQSWEDFTRERVLEPLGMDTATLSIDELKQHDDIATPSILNVREGSLENTDFLALGADVPAGAINASAEDMARYILFQLGDGAPLISQASLDEMHAPQIDAPGFNILGIAAEQARAAADNLDDVPPSLIPEEQYGFYWGIDTFLDEKLVQHGGNVIGATANVTLLPEQDSGVVILANADSANFFMEAVRLHVAEVLLGQTEPDVNAVIQAQLEVVGQDNASRNADLEAVRTYQADADELDALTGTYESLADPEPTQVSLTDEGELKLESGLQALRFSSVLLPIGNDRFIAADDILAGAVVRFVKGEEGRTIELESVTGAIPIASLED